jgi:HD-GYP domain-containing protein (c-di-GMP phosphodiesterase class II)
MPTGTRGEGRVRLVELLGALSLATDAANGFPAQTAICTAVLAVALARLCGHHGVARDVLHGCLLRHIGCTGFAVEEAHIFGAGDDVSVRSVMAEVDFAQPDDAMRRIQAGVARHATPTERDRALAAFAVDPQQAAADHAAAQCDASERLSALLPVSPTARTIAAEAFERWDGHGGPNGKSGEDLSLAGRLGQVGCVASVFYLRGGPVAALRALASRSGGLLDPSLVDIFIEAAPELFAAIESAQSSAWDFLLASEPQPAVHVSTQDVERTALAFARFADLKSSWFSGHSEAVADIAVRAGQVLGLKADTIGRLSLAGLLHDIGCVGVPTGIWDLRRPLSPPERRLVELHSWETQRVLGATALFDQVATLASSAHERLDGSGYYRGLPPTALDRAARVLAAADVACALAQDRPHRPAFSKAKVALTLAEEASAGRLDTEAVRAVAEVIGAVGTRVVWPLGLSDREVQVVRLVATGATNKGLARALSITAKTAAHHVAHIYDKTGSRSRAGVTLFAVEHGLVGPGTDWTSAVE